MKLKNFIIELNLKHVKNISNIMITVSQFLLLLRNFHVCLRIYKVLLNLKTRGEFSENKNLNFPLKQAF